QSAAAQVAERAGSIATQTKQTLSGVIENMSWMEMPDGTRMEVFGSGGGASVAANLSTTLEREVPLLAQIPLDTRLREGSDAGTRMEVVGSGGGASVAANLSTTLEREVPLLAQIPLDTRLREGSDAGTPVVLSSPDSPAAQAFDTLAESLRRRTRGLSGRSLGLSPV